MLLIGYIKFNWLQFIFGLFFFNCRGVVVFLVLGVLSYWVCARFLRKDLKSYEMEGKIMTKIHLNLKLVLMINIKSSSQIIKFFKIEK